MAGGRAVAPGAAHRVWDETDEIYLVAKPAGNDGTAIMNAREGNDEMLPKPDGPGETGMAIDGAVTSGDTGGGALRGDIGGGTLRLRCVAGNENETNSGCEVR